MAISSETEVKGEFMAYYVYMMTNRYQNVLYTGVTNDLIRRVYEHRNHLMTEDVRSAIEREKQIKSWSRARKNALVESQNPTWEDQYPMILQG